MTDEKKREINLNRIEVMAKDIITYCNSILADLKEVEGYDDLFIIEENFYRIQRNAEDGRLITRNTYDLFEEDED